MSYTILNQRVFGIKLFQDPTDIHRLVSYFYSGIPLCEPEKIVKDEVILNSLVESLIPKVEPIIEDVIKEKCDIQKKNRGLQLPTDTLFWSIYIAMYGESEFMLIGSKYSNREWEEKNNIRKEFENNPKELQRTNHKVTLGGIKEMMSEYMTGNKTSLLGVIGLSVYYKMPIVLIDETKRTYMSFFPQNTERPVCIIYKRNGKSRNHYELYRGGETYNTLCHSYFGLESYLRPLKAISTYSRSILNELADRFKISREKKSKEDIYRELSEYLVWL
jgi:hypothetical protein